MINILIIDDDDDDAYLFCETVKELIPTANCFIRKTGDSAFQFLCDRTIRPDYIFLDVFLGGSDSKEWLLKIKSLEHLGNIPVIMYSGLTDVNQIIEYKSLGAAGYICKPQNLDTLRSIVASILISSDQ